MRQFCELHHLNASFGEITELLAWADWRFQWIHPFKDSNGKIGRVLVAALVFKLGLPPVETAPRDSSARRQYLQALQTADTGNMGPLNALWMSRIYQATSAKNEIIERSLY